MTACWHLRRLVRKVRRSRPAILEFALGRRTDYIARVGIPAGHPDALSCQQKQPLTDWRQQLAIIAANRTPGDEAVIGRLGGQLMAAGQVSTARFPVPALWLPWTA